MFYQVFYTIKRNRSEAPYHIFIYASNEKEAVAKCYNIIMERTGRNAFHRVAIRNDISQKCL